MDSRLYSVADELVPAATWATFATASDGVGDIVTCAGEGETMQWQGRRGQTRTWKPDRQTDSKQTASRQQADRQTDNKQTAEQSRPC